jgi:plasmid stabilization system protein ParE
MNIRMTAGARVDLRDTIDWYDERQPGLGDEFNDAFERAARAILADPRMYPLAEDEAEGFEARVYLMPRFRYRVVYAVFEAEILIAAIARGRRRSGYWHHRLTEDS